MRPNFSQGRILVLSVAAVLFAHFSSSIAATPTATGTKDTNSSATPALAGTPEVSPSLMADSSRRPTAITPAPRLSGYEILLRGRQASSRIYQQLSSVVCRERIERFKGSPSDVEGRALDVITSDVSMEEGVERYSNIRQNNKSRASISHIGGAWSEGEYSTFLRQTAAVLSSDKIIKMGVITRLNRTPAILFPYDVSQEDSTWDFLVRSKHYLLGFHGEVWISQTTGEVLRIRRTASHVPAGTGISEVDWSVDFGPNDLDGHSFILPSRATYSVAYSRDRHREWNVISFADYHHYGVDITIHYN
jgi:hypothetical protein